MAKPHERVISFIIAILFFVVASATAVFVIYDATHNKDTTDTTTSDAANNQQDTFCSQTDTAGTTGVEKLAAPDVYKTSEKVESLQIKDLAAGTGDEAKSGDCLYMKYYGTLATDGTVFDENFTKDTAFKFQLGASQVIPGWDQGLTGMKVGGMRQLVIPAQLAYGDKANGKIPANSNLVFVVKLLKIEKKK